MPTPLPLSPAIARAVPASAGRRVRVPGRRLWALAGLALVLTGCRPGMAVPPPSGDSAPGLNASGTQRTFSAQELVATAAETKTALKLGGAVLDQAQLASQGPRAVPSLATGAVPERCAALTAAGTPTGLDRAAAALILAPSDTRAQSTAVGLTSHATPEAAAATAKAVGEGAASCARYDATVGGQRVPVTAAVADPGADAPIAVMVTSTAHVPDPSGGSTPQERSAVRAVAAKGTVTVEVLLTDTRPEDAAATVRGYIDMAFARLPL